MQRYFVEYTSDDDCIIISQLCERPKALASARRISRITKNLVFVVDENRTGGIAFASGYPVHKDGAAI